MKELKLHLKRRFRRENYTIGKLYVNDVPFCDTLENKDRDLRQDMPLDVIKRIKVYGETAIPTGTYSISMSRCSPKFAQIEYYKDFCGGYMPRLMNVPGFRGILIHRGNREDATEGCLLVGDNTSPGGLSHSKDRWEQLMQLYLIPAKKLKIPITITID